MSENWARIEEFPSYNISDQGRVLRWTTGNFVRESYTRDGHVKIGLVQDGVQYQRSLAPLVAVAFVEGRTPLFNTPIHLDGNQANNRSENLVWRPRWFAWKYARQFYEIDISDVRHPVIEVNSQVVYPNMVDAAIINGLLFKDVLLSIMKQLPTFPTWQIFAFVE